MYRKFWLVNSLGDKYYLSHPEKELNSAFFHSPSGLGFARSISTQKVGNSEMITSQAFTLTNITGEVLFFKDSNGDKYQEYQNFIKFVKYKPLEFHYQTPNDTESYHCDVSLTQVDKSEVAEDGVLHVPVNFHRLSEWLTDKDYTVVLDNNPIDEGKHYDLIRDYHYAGTNLSNTTIINNGTDDVGFVIEVEGECSNLYFTLSQGGDTYGVCKILGTYDFIRVDSVEKTENIYLEQNGSVVTNPEAYQDFTVANGNSYITWCKFRVGETILNITMGNIDDFNGRVIVSFKNSFASV